MPSSSEASSGPVIVVLIWRPQGLFSRSAAK